MSPCWPNTPQTHTALFTCTYFSIIPTVEKSSCWTLICFTFETHSWNTLNYKYNSAVWSEKPSSHTDHIMEFVFQLKCTGKMSSQCQHRVLSNTKLTLIFLMVKTKLVSSNTIRWTISCKGQWHYDLLWVLEKCPSPALHIRKRGRQGEVKQVREWTEVKTKERMEKSCLQNTQHHKDPHYYVLWKRILKLC